jgi:DNA-binding Lrp family transcriptional regulator
MYRKFAKKREESAQMLDELDTKILKLLSKNSKLSYRQIASFLNISTNTVIKRIRNLEKEGIIKRYTIEVNQEKIGYDLFAIIEITVSKGKLVEVEKEIAKKENVCAVYDVTGLTDAFIVAKFRNRKELNDFVKLLLSMPYIERTNTHLVLNIFKQDFSEV